jgi:hypothetical protein
MKTRVYLIVMYESPRDQRMSAAKKVGTALFQSAVSILSAEKKRSQQRHSLFTKMSDLLRDLQSS